MCVSGPRRAVERVDERDDASAGGSPRSAAAGRASSGTPERPPRVRKRRPSHGVSTGSLQRGAYAARSSAVSSPPRSSRELEQRRGRSCPCTRRAAPSAASDSSAVTSPGCSSTLARFEQRAARRVHARAFAHRHHRLEHREARDVRRRHRDAVAREPQRRLDEPRPRQPAVRVPQLAEPGGHARHRARRGADRVVHELRAERHLEVHELRLAPLGAEPGHRAEAVEVARGAGRRVVVDRVPAAEQPGHHRLGDARRERRRNRRVGGAAAVGEDLGARGRRRRDGPAATPRDLTATARGSASQPMRAMPGAREVEPVAHQRAARVAVDAAADRPRR